MLVRTIRAEWMKLRRSPVWLAFFLLPILAAVMGTFNYLQNTNILQDEWYSLWTQHTLFTCYFFLPAINCWYFFIYPKVVSAITCNYRKYIIVSVLIIGSETSGIIHIIRSIAMNRTTHISNIIVIACFLLAIIMSNSKTDRRTI